LLSFNAFGRFAGEASSVSLFIAAYP